MGNKIALQEQQDSSSHPQQIDANKSKQTLERAELVAISTVIAPRPCSLMTAEHRSSSSRSTAHSRNALALRPAVPRRRRTEAPLLLEVAPPLHGDLAAVELAVTVVATLVSAGNGACGLSSVAPTEVIEVPEGICGEDEVPDWERDEVDQHPGDVDPSVRGDDDEDTGETKDEYEKDQRDGRGWCVCEGRLDTEGN